MLLINKVARGALAPAQLQACKTTAWTQPSAPNVPEVYVQDADPEIAKFQEFQKTAARPAPAEAAKTLLSQAKFATLSTLASGRDADGFPFGSVVDFAVDSLGRPVIATSSLSPHTGDLVTDGRCCLTVMAPGYQGPQDARFTLVGRAGDVPEAERAAVREAYLKRHPNAFWVDFGDFRWFRVEPVSGWFIAGFGGNRKISAEEFLKAKPDPVAGFSGPVCSHMNADHQDDLKAMVVHYAGLRCDSVRMLDLDRLGVNMEATRQGSTFNMRLPFVRPAEDRKGIKEVIVEMTRAARASLA